MSIYRTQGEKELIENFKIIKNHSLKYGGNGSGEKEWDPKTDSRIFEPAWEERYNYEANIISQICTEYNFSKILELGSGPGKLADTVKNTHPQKLNYTLIDKPNAKIQNKNHGLKCDKFIVKDLNNKFDTSGLDSPYDLIIANDFLEHIANVTDCLISCYNISHDSSKILISVPNWRMGHSFQYKGLFDYDNWVFAMEAHGWKCEVVYPSNLKCQYYPKLSSESLMPDELIQSWNWYFIGSKIKTNE